MWVSDLYLMVQWLYLISWRLFDGLMLYWRYRIDSVWCKHWPETIYVGHWPIFQGPVILPYILKTIWWTNVITGILDPCDAKIYHIKCMWVSDLQFMVQWFGHILKTSWWRNVGMLYWRYWYGVTLSLTNKYICRSVTYILWYSDSALYIQYYLMNKPHSLDIGSVWYGPLTCISWSSNFESFTVYLFLPIVVCWRLIWKYL